MNKAKFILAAMIVFGTVAGLVAFRVTRSVDYCYTATVNHACPTNARCPEGTKGLVHMEGEVRCYTTTSNYRSCSVSRPTCVAVANIKFEE